MAPPVCLLSYTGVQVYIELRTKYFPVQKKSQTVLNRMLYTGYPKAFLFNVGNKGIVMLTQNTFSIIKPFVVNNRKFSSQRTGSITHPGTMQARARRVEGSTAVRHTQTADTNAVGTAQMPSVRVVTLLQEKPTLKPDTSDTCCEGEP